jgi:hypothetical protein
MPVEIRSIVLWSQPGKIVCETQSQKKQSQKLTDSVFQGVVPELKTQYCPPAQKKNEP